MAGASGDRSASLDQTGTQVQSGAVGGGPYASVRGLVHYCRHYAVDTGTGVRMACTDGSQTLNSSAAVDPGRPEAAAWVSTAGDLFYCRRLGTTNFTDSRLACSGLEAGTTAVSGVEDWGYTDGAQWVRTGSGIAYCRRVGASNPPNTRLSCTVFDGGQFRPTVLSDVLDWGSVTAASWMTTSDGAAFCRRVGTVNFRDSRLACTPFTGTAFAATVVTTSIEDWGYDRGAAWTTVSGRPNYCRRVGASNPPNTRVSCTTFNGTSFAPTALSPVIDWANESLPSAWVGGKYCRFTGEPAAPACLAFTGTGFRPDVRGTPVGVSTVGSMNRWLDESGHPAFCAMTERTGNGATVSCLRFITAFSPVTPFRTTVDAPVPAPSPSDGVLGLQWSPQDQQLRVTGSSPDATVTLTAWNADALDFQHLGDTVRQTDSSGSLTVPLYRCPWGYYGLPPKVQAYDWTSGRRSTTVTVDAGLCLES